MTARLVPVRLLVLFNVFACVLACGGKQTDDRLGDTDRGLAGEGPGGGGGGGSAPAPTNPPDGGAPAENFSDGFENVGGATSCGWKGRGPTMTTEVHSGTSACKICKPDSGYGDFAGITLTLPASAGDWDLHFFVTSSGAASVTAGVSFSPGSSNNGSAGQAGSIAGTGWTEFGVVNVRANPGTTEATITIGGEPCVVVDDVTFTKRK